MAELTVDLGIDPLVQLVNFRTQLARIQVNRGELRLKQLVEGSVEDTDNFRALVVHYRVMLLVP